MQEIIERILQECTWGCSTLEEGHQCINCIHNAGHREIICVKKLYQEEPVTLK